MSLKVIKIKGNIFDTKADVICNAVNCIGVMGAGVAKAFADKFPEMYWSYQNSCKSKMVNIGKGHYFYLSDEDNWKMIANVPTMFYPGSIANLGDISLSLCDLFEVMNTHHLNTVVMPFLGCGIGRVKPKEFENLLYNFRTKHDISVLLVEYAGN